MRHADKRIFKIELNAKRNFCMPEDFQMSMKVNINYTNEKCN